MMRPAPDSAIIVSPFSTRWKACTSMRCPSLPFILAELYSHTTFPSGASSTTFWKPCWVKMFPLGNRCASWMPAIFNSRSNDPSGAMMASRLVESSPAKKRRPGPVCSAVRGKVQVTTSAASAARREISACIGGE